MSLAFSKPVPFAEALRDRRARQLLRTALSSDEIKRLGADLAQRAVVSAKVQHAGVLDRLTSLITRIVSPETVDGRPAQTGEYMDQARARELLKEFLASIHYEPEPGKRGTIQDLTTDARLNVMLKTGADMTRWAAHHQMGQSRAVLDEYPAQELRRFEARRERRVWRAVWEANGGRVFPGGDPEFGGRLVALKNDPIWRAISDFDLPHPPFAFGSGVGISPVARDDAIALGLIDRDTQVEPDTRLINEGYEASVAEFSAALQAALAKDPRLQVEDGVLKWRAS